MVAILGVLVKSTCGGDVVLLLGVSSGEFVGMKVGFTDGSTPDGFGVGRDDGIVLGEVEAVLG